MLLTAGVPEFTRWAALADHLTLRMQLTITDFLVWVECHIEENKEAGSVSSKHEKIKERLKVLEGWRSIGHPVDALVTMHDVKDVFQREDQMRALKKQIYKS